MPRPKPISTLDGDPRWYMDAIVYQTHVRAFHDSSGDGIGDFRGLAEKLDYVRDLVGSVTRPVRELKGFQRVRLAPGERREITFRLSTDELAFHGRDMQRRAEPGQFHAWIGGSSLAKHGTEFEVVPHG